MIDGRVRMSLPVTGESVQRLMPSLEPALSHNAPEWSVFVPTSAAMKSGAPQYTGTFVDIVGIAAERSAATFGVSVPALAHGSMNGGNFAISSSVSPF